MRGMEVIPFIIQHVYGRWTDYKVLSGVTGILSLVLSLYKLVTLNTE